MRLLYTSTLCIWDNSTLVMLYFYGDLMRIFYFIKNMLRFLPIALPLKHGAFHLGIKGRVDFNPRVSKRKLLLGFSTNA
jgi:hypothetical protein